MIRQIDDIARGSVGQSGISPEARAFLNGPPTYAEYVPGPDEIDAWRAEIRKSCTPLAEQSLRRHAVTTQEISVGGVECLEVLPSGSSPHILLYCFGGGFVCGSAFEDLPIISALARYANARVIAPHYRLAPEHPFPAAFEDGMAVARALASETERMALAGESAGGNLALTLAVQMREEGLRMPNALALLSPWCDLTNSGESLTKNDGRDPTLRCEGLFAAAKAYAGEKSVENPQISPLFAPLDGLPPTIITTGTRDLLLSQSKRLAQALEQAGEICDLRIWNEMWHVFEFYDVPEADQSLRGIAAFLGEHL